MCVDAAICRGSCSECTNEALEDLARHTEVAGLQQRLHELKAENERLRERVEWMENEFACCSVCQRYHEHCHCTSAQESMRRNSDRFHEGIARQLGEVEKLLDQLDDEAPQKSTEPVPAARKLDLAADREDPCAEDDVQCGPELEHEFDQAAHQKSTEPDCSVCGDSGYLEGGWMGGLVDCDCRIEPATVKDSLIVGDRCDCDKVECPDCGVIGCPDCERCDCEVGS